MLLLMLMLMLVMVVIKMMTDMFTACHVSDNSQGALSACPVESAKYVLYLGVTVLILQMRRLKTKEINYFVNTESGSGRGRA